MDTDYTLSTRNLIDWATLSTYLPIVEAYELSFKNKIDKESEKEVTSIVKKYFLEDEIITK
jgi:hypothetical protein